MRSILALTAAALALAPAAQADRLGYHGCASCWDRVAACESGNRWNLNTGNGYFGGLQFLPSTWWAYGGGRYARMPHYASRWQQIAVASRMNLGHWPVCGRRYYG